MEDKKQLDTIAAQVALFFSHHSFQYAGGRATVDWIVQDNLKITSEHLAEMYGFTLVQAIELKKRLADLNNLMMDFPIILQNFVSSSSFEDEWKKMLPKEIENLVFMHTESYRILRQKKSPYELVDIDKQEILNLWCSSYDNINYKKLQEAFNLPEIFDSKPENKLQLIKQHQALVNAGYDVGMLNDKVGSFDYNIKLMNMFSKKHKNDSVEDILEITQKLGLDLPWHIKGQLNFIETNEVTGKKIKLV